MFINKAQNLEYLNSFKLKNIGVPRFIFFNLSEWKKNKQKLILQIINQLNKKICIRSSYYKEDNAKSSLAGKFDSFINIKNEKKNIIYSVENLIHQYRKYNSKSNFFF